MAVATRWLGRGEWWQSVAMLGQLLYAARPAKPPAVVPALAAGFGWLNGPKPGVTSLRTAVRK